MLGRQGWERQDGHLASDLQLPGSSLPTLHNLTQAQRLTVCQALGIEPGAHIQTAKNDER